MTDYSGMMSEEEFLEHFGVKGMKWGKRKDDEGGSGRSSGSKPTPKPETRTKTPEERLAEYMAVNPPKLSKAQQEANLAENQKKFNDKFGGDGDAPKDGASTPGDGSSFWKPSKKQIVYGVLGAAAVGAVIYGAYKYGKYMNPPPGTPVDANRFKLMVTNSKLRSWTGGDYLKKSSFDQKEFTLPAGHTFHRISTRVETGGIGSITGGGGGNYATHSLDDFHRYVAGFRAEKGPGATFHHITFTAKQEIKVPDLLTRLDALGETMKKSTGTMPSAAEIRAEYNRLSGGSWSSSRATAFFAELSSKGYHAIIDDMDAGVIGESPLFVFAKEAFTEKVASPFTDVDISAAEQLLTEISNRK